LKDKAKEEKEKKNNVMVSYDKIFVKDKWLRWNEREREGGGRIEEDRGGRKGKGWLRRYKKRIKNLFLKHCGTV